MSKFKLDVWVTQQFLKTWTHIIKGSFADPQFATQGASDLFCYNRNTRVGAFFATVKNGRLDDGTPVQDGLRQVGANHTFSRRWTHIVNVGTMLLFYDAAGGVGEFHTTDGRGNLILKKRHTGWRKSWALIVAGRFGKKIIPTPPFTPPKTRPKANLLFYDATEGTIEFYFVDNSGNIQLERRSTGLLKSWHSIITGNFSNGEFDDLLFYDKSRGIGAFYKTDSNIGKTRLSRHTNWRTTLQHVVSGQFLQNAPFDGLLFYEEGSGHTEFYSTNGAGGISRIDVSIDNQWRLPWQAILPGEFTPNIGLIGTSRLCNYDSRDGTIRTFFFEPVTIQTVFDLNGRWTNGSSRAAVISAAFTSLTVDMSAHNRPAARGEIVDASTIKVAFPDDTTHTGKLQLPNTIKWSNGSAWKKA